MKKIPKDRMGKDINIGDFVMVKQGSELIPACVVHVMPKTIRYLYAARTLKCSRVYGIYRDSSLSSKTINVSEIYG